MLCMCVTSCANWFQKRVMLIVVVTIRALFLSCRLIDYAYTSEMSIDKNNVQALLAAATFLDISPVRDACCNFLERNMDESNCLMIHCFAELHSCTNLADKAKTFALQKFTSVSLHAEFLEITKEKVKY